MATAPRRRTQAERTQRRIRAAIDTALGQDGQNHGGLLGARGHPDQVRTCLEMFEHPEDEERALIVLWGSTFPADASGEAMVEADHPSYDG